MANLAREEAAVAQQNIDKIQQACAVLKKLMPEEYAYVMNGIVDMTGSLSRDIIIESEAVYIGLKRDALLDVIDHNKETKPKPFHHNLDLMTAALEIEARHG